MLQSHNHVTVNSAAALINIVTLTFRHIWLVVRTLIVVNARLTQVIEALSAFLLIMFLVENFSTLNSDVLVELCWSVSATQVRLQLLLQIELNV